MRSAFINNKAGELMKRNDLFSNADFILSLIENSYDGIFITDKNGLVLYVNNAYEKLAGHDRSEYIGKYMTDLLSSGIMDTYITKDVVASGEIITAREELVSGKKVLITGSPVFNDSGEIIAVVTNVRDVSDIISLEKKNSLSKEVISLYKKQYFNSETFVCESPATMSVFNFAHKVASKDSTVLLTGETGVGKEVVAQYIHSNSERKNKNYIKINCGAIPANLLESELFGYVGGAFTGADPNGKHGMFEMADQGTLFLDEIGELQLDLQSALLRALQDGEITRVGSTQTQKVDVRIIAATNRDLKQMVADGTFREDLYYRLNVISIDIPPLRERQEDIPALAELFIEKLNKKYRTEKQATESFLLELMTMQWPGNIRELSNFVERQYIMHDSDIISSVNNYENNMLAERGLDDNAEADNFNLDRMVNSVEAQMIKAALKKCKNMSEAAKILGISQPTFSRKYNKYKDMGLI